MKVYCIDCPFYFQFRNKKDACAAYDNMVDTYKAPNSKPIKPPNVINARNDCEWFETKESFLNRTMELEEKKKPWWKVW